MVNPKVKPPTPHNNPKKKDQNKLSPGAARSTAGKSLVMMNANVQGARIQLKKPPANQ
jgi:hypothetical protein